MSLLEGIQAVTFDVGGTLIRPWPSVGHVYSQSAACYGHPEIPPDTLNRQFAAAWRAKKNFDHSRQAWLELVQRTFAGLVSERGVSEFFDDIYQRFSQRAAWHVFDDVAPTLKFLQSRGLKLAIISNWDERLRPLLGQLQLNAYFEVIVVSIEAGFAKPSREIFDRAVSMLSLPATSILHIGDSFEEDIVGAKAAGLRALLLNRKAGATGAQTISTLTSLTYQGTSE